MTPIVPPPGTPVIEELVQAGSLRTLVRTSGQGYPLVLIHGLGGPHAWERVIPGLADSFRVVALDLPGFGKSDCPPRGFSVEQYGDFIVDLLDARSIRRCTLVGISFGGEIAVSCAARHPGRIDALVLISATGMGRHRILATSPVFRNILDFVLKRWVLRSLWMTEMISRRIYDDISRRPQELAGSFHREMTEVNKREAWLEAFWQTLDPPKEFRRWLRDLRVPVMLLWGENDRAVPLKFAREFQSLAPDSRLVTVPACAHAMPLEQPEVMCREVKTFLARPKPGPG